MFGVKRIRADDYLNKFINYCKEQYIDNLLAIVIYGSYAWGYFDKRKSDYDVFVIFKDRTPKDKKIAQKEFAKKFPKIALQYYCTTKELIRKVNEGHFSVYITLLKSGRILYARRGYKKFLKDLKKINFVEEMLDTTAREFKAKFEIEVLKKSAGYKAAKWALPAIRKRLQLLTYTRRRKLIWKLKRVVRYNKDILSRDEAKFILALDKKVKTRSEDFSADDKKTAIGVLKKIDDFE